MNVYRTYFLHGDKFLAYLTIYIYIYILVIGGYLHFFQFPFYWKISDSDSNSDTCKHSLFTSIWIGIIMFNIVIPNYFLP